MVGTAGFVLIEEVSLFEAFDMVLITITTVGFGETIELDVGSECEVAGKSIRDSNIRQVSGAPILALESQMSGCW